MKTNAKILICYNSPVSIFSVYSGKPTKDHNSQNDLSEIAFSDEIEVTKKSLKKYFTTVKALAIDKNVERNIKNISSFNPDAIFNFVESVEGIASYEYCMAGLYQLLDYRFTGNIPSCLGNCLNKSRTKHILRSMNIETPKFLTIGRNQNFRESEFKLRFPVILKLINEDASIGISELSVVHNIEGLRKQLRFLKRTYNQEIIIEEYIDGRELNVAILGNQVLPISEIQFSTLPEGLPKIVTYEGKWMENSVYYDNTKPRCPAKLDQKTKKKVEEIALRTFEAMNCRDYARVDIRLDKNKNPYVIEVNPNPDISTDSGFVRAASAAGISYRICY